MTGLRAIPRHAWLFGLLALVIATVITRGVVQSPPYTDAFYYFNAAERLAAGNGLTDTYLWTYIGAPDPWPDDNVAPSHLYWMPFASLLAGGGMAVADAPGHYPSAQAPFTLLFFGMACVAFWLGGRLGGSARHMWVAGLIALFSGFYTRFWGATSTFAPYAFFGALALVFIGIAGRDKRAHWWLLAGICAGFGHLTRSDGLLLLMVAFGVLFWPWAQLSVRRRGLFALVLAAGYLAVMGPWFLRNLAEIGAILPVGGTDTAWYVVYDELVSYPPGAEPGDLFADGLGAFFETRWLALQNNFGTFIGVEGLVIMAPLMLYGLWNRRREPLLHGFWLYALGLHLAMTLVFPLPGYRGGLFHSAAALVPWWAALGVAGLDDTVDWIASKRRRWRPRTAKPVFSAGLVILAVTLSLSNASGGISSDEIPRFYRNIAQTLPADARVMINDPTALYYFTGLGGVVIPNEDPAVIRDIADTFNVDYLLLERQGAVLGVPQRFDFDVDNPPNFLTEIDFDGGYLYQVGAYVPPFLQQPPASGGNDGIGSMEGDIRDQSTP